MIVLLRQLIVEFVEFPDEVEIKEIEIGKQTLLTIKANPKDIAKIVGKEGSTIHSLRKIVKIIGAKRRINYILDLAQPNE